MAVIPGVNYEITRELANVNTYGQGNPRFPFGRGYFRWRVVGESQRVRTYVFSMCLYM